MCVSLSLSVSWYPCFAAFWWKCVYSQRLNVEGNLISWSHYIFSGGNNCWPIIQSNHIVSGAHGYTQDLHKHEYSVLVFAMPLLFKRHTMLIWLFFSTTAVIFLFAPQTVAEAFREANIAASFGKPINFWSLVQTSVSLQQCLSNSRGEIERSALQQMFSTCTCCWIMLTFLTQLRFKDGAVPKRAHYQMWCKSVHPS